MELMFPIAREGYSHSKAVYALLHSSIKMYFNVLFTSRSIKWLYPSAFPTRIILRMYFSYFTPPPPIIS